MPVPDLKFNSAYGQIMRLPRLAMNQKIPAFVLVLFLYTGLPSRGVEPANLALAAQAAASSHAEGAGAENINDSDVGTSWTPAGVGTKSGWVELRWSQAVTFTEVLIRQSFRQELSQVALQTEHHGEWETLKTIGDGTNPLPKLILVTVPREATSGLRLTGFKGNPSFYEVEVFEGHNPPVIEMASDARGHIIGMVTDAWGSAPMPLTLVALTGTAGGRPWRTVATTDQHGMFSVLALTGLAGTVRAVARPSGKEIEKSVEAGDLLLALTPEDISAPNLDLTGSWKFATDPPADFYRPEFDDSEWKPINVPSHWVMQGFKSEEGVGGYRREMLIPREWSGKRIKIRFDGVYSGAEVWLNGQRLGSHEGGFTPFELDSTGAAHAGANVIAVKVWEHTRSRDLDSMSLYADFWLTGIMRKVYAFAVPPAHIEELHFATQFDPHYQNATLKINLKIVNETSRPLRSGEVRWSLKAPNNELAGVAFPPVQFGLPPWGQMEKTLEFLVPRPVHWEAEHPELYRLTAGVYDAGTPTESVSRRIGFRQVEVRGTQILINGVPVKLRGTCHHDSDPVRGRAVTPEETRRDLELIKEANLDALRTSHYPAIEDLYDGADELGIYVEAEAPFCWVNRPYDLRLAPLVIQRTAELLQRDRSHPSVIIWSLVNESSWGPIFERSYEYVKQSDPTRPLSAATTKDLDIATLHNPLSIARIRENEKLQTPLIFDESLCIFQGIWGDYGEVWRDPGYRDYWVLPLIPIWEEMLKSGTTQGSMIWAWSDDIFQVPGRASEHGRGLTKMHDVDYLYGAPGMGVVGDAPWGVVDGWRRKKPEFWHTKKLHSPIRVTTLSLPTPAPGELPRISVHNRYEFTNLSELVLAWKLGPEQGELHPNLAPQQTAWIEIPLRQAVAPGSRLHIHFLDGIGRLVDEESIQFGEAPKTSPPAPDPGKLRIRREHMLAGDFLSVVGKSFEIAFDNEEGGIKRLLADGQDLLFETPSLHIQPIESGSPDLPHPWSWKLTRPLAVTRDGSEVVVTASGKYLDGEGATVYRITPTGELNVHYDFTYLGPDVTVREIGMRIGVPPWCDNLQWSRRGEWSTYPGDHIGRNEGRARAHSGIERTVPPTHAFSQDDTPMGTNDFRSTKRNLQSASITSEGGYGLAIVSNGEQHLRASAETDRIALFINDWFGGTSAIAWGEWSLNYGKGHLLRTHDQVQGNLRLRILSGK